MNLEELKHLRQKNFQEHKAKKRKYYLKKKLEMQSKKTAGKSSAVDYDQELYGGDFKQKLKDIAKKQKKHIDDRQEQIVAKLQEYKDKKQEYYQKNKEKRLEYDKEYRERKKEELKQYRKDYYQKNKTKILNKQKQKREST
ncbi:MAG: hypothetical protein U9N30_03150 [Campylobacterota bacterium]|nr:hypothetical protein [Campylobacterota bacterium]